MSGSKQKIKSITSDKLHNKNCFSYLRNVKLPRAVLDLNLLPESIVKGISSLQEPEFRLMSQLPKDLSKYKGSYIYCNNNDSKKLYYIQSNGATQEVKIDDFNQFDQNLTQINTQGSDKFNLTTTQVETLITENGGHIPYDPSFPYADLYTQFLAHLEENIDSIYDNIKIRLIIDYEIIGLHQTIRQSNVAFMSPQVQRLYISTLGVLPSIKDIGAMNPNENAKRITLKEMMDQKAERLKEETRALDEFILSLYANDNHILKDTFENIREITLQQNPSSSGIEKSISHHVSDKETPINQKSSSPAYEGSAVGRFTAMMSKDYKPQHGTSLSTIRHYRSNVNGPIEYRFGTQGQRHQGEARVSPLFERFLKIEAEREQERVELAKQQRAERLNAKKQTQEEIGLGNIVEQRDNDDVEEIDEDRITHIYFNLLGRDRKGLEGSKEKALTEQLEALELHTKEDGVQQIGHKNVAVITLPADKGLMSQHAYADTTTKYNAKNVREDFLRIAQESKGYDVHLRDKLPDDISQYKGSYIYCKDDNSPTKLFYINSNGEPDEVPIDNFPQFEKNLNDINKQKTDPIHLTDAQAKSLLASPDHTPPGLMEVKDFHISERIRRKIFKDGARYSPETEAKILKRLLDESFEALGYSNKDELTEAERQAVWFHFIKYQLTNHIIDSLNPKSINFSCKDAIDRGGVASAYYNLVKSFELTPKEQENGVIKIPMSREEFEEALHAAPTMVKGRGMNHHIKLIWNSVDAYVNANYQQLKDDSQKAWLIEWRDFNCPHQRVEKLLDQRIKEGKEEIEKHLQDLINNSEQVESASKLAALTQGNQVLIEIEKQRALGVSGKRLLLETAVMTTSMAISPHTQAPNLDRYEKLNKELAINYPDLKVLGGLMKVFAGTVVDAISAVLSAVSGGKIDIQSDLTSRGWATFNSGWELTSRKALQSKMKDQLDAMRSKENKQNVDLSPADEETSAKDRSNSSMECS
ncbi:hypothetical protein [Legionella sp. WA2022007384]